MSCCILCHAASHSVAAACVAHKIRAHEEEESGSDNMGIDD